MLLCGEGGGGVGGGAGRGTCPCVELYGSAGSMAVYPALSSPDPHHLPVLTLPPSVLFLAGDVSGAGALVLRATHAPAALSSSSAAAIVALRAYLVRLQPPAGAAHEARGASGGHGVSKGVRRRCNRTLQAVEEMVAQAAATR